MKKIYLILFLFFLALIYLFPLAKQGLVLLPLDLLVAKYHPWYAPAQIFLKNPYMQDSIIQLFPWRHLVFESLSQGVIPLWNPYQHLGMPFMASLKPMVFYPFNILFMLGEIKSWNILLLSQIFFSLLFSFLLAKDFKLGLGPGLLTSFSFAFSSLMIGVLEFGSEGHVLLWLPLMILSAKRYLDKQRAINLLYLGLSVSCSFFAGQLQYTAYMLILIACFIIYYGKKQNSGLANYAYLFLSLYAGIGIASIQLLPTMEMFSRSYRAVFASKEAFYQGLVKPIYLLRLFSPDYFGNPVDGNLAIGYIETSGYFAIIPFFFCFYAFFKHQKTFFEKFFFITFLAAAFFSLDKIAPLIYQLKIPAISAGSGGRIFFLTLFSGSMLAGFGCFEFLKNKQALNRRIIILFTFLFSLAILLGSWSNIRFSFFIFAAFLISFLVYYRFKSNFIFSKEAFVLVILGLTFFDFFRLGYRFLTFSNQKFLNPQTDAVRFIKNSSRENLGRTYGLTEPELGTLLGIQTVETYNPLYLARTANLLSGLQNIHIPSPSNKYFLKSTKDELKFTLDFLGVRFLAVPKDKNPSLEYFQTSGYEASFSRIFTDDRYAIYQNHDAFPRFGLFYKVHLVADNQEALEAIMARKDDLQKSLILTTPLPFDLQSGTGSASLTKEGLNSLSFAVKTDKPALLYLSDTFYPGWKATVNSQPVEIRQANYNFRAVAVPAGESVVDFKYQPESFRNGAGLSLFSLIFLLTLTQIAKNKR